GSPPCTGRSTSPGTSSGSGCATGGASRRRHADVYRGLSVIAMAPVLVEERKIGNVVLRTPRAVADEVLVIDDGSTDRSAAIARDLGATVLQVGRTVGVGAALRAGYRYAVEHGFDLVIGMADNDKGAT